ncbi:MAG: hypothetical protein WDW36_008971 [Sanguina aurantia]
MPPLRVKRYLLTGLLTFIPLWVTWLVFKFVLSLLAGIGAPLVGAMLSALALVAPNAALVRHADGFVANRVIGQRFINAFDGLLARIPLVQTIYGGTKKLMAVLQNKPSGVQRVVLVEFPRRGMKVVGFVTRVMNEDGTGREMASVFIPTTPNPTGGYLVVVPLDELTPTDWTMDQAMAFIISARDALLLALTLTLLAPLAHASVQIVVDGVDDSLKDASARVASSTRRSENDLRENDAGAHRQHVSPGAPVKVTEVKLALDAQASAIAPVRRAMRAMERLKDQPLNDGAYDDLRDRLSGALTANGFLDARLVTHRVAVNRADHAAVITLAWQAGARYRYGDVHSSSICSHTLNGADYFAVVNVLPDIDTAKNGIVNIGVQLAPAKRTIYTGGPFIGTDTGFGVRGGIERRWVNRRGHKWKNEVVLAQRIKTVSTLYSVPLPGANQRSLNYGATFRDSNTTTSQSRTLELVANETELWHGWTRTLGVHALSGTFTVGKIGNEPDSTPGIEHGRSTEVFARAHGRTRSR